MADQQVLAAQARDGRGKGFARRLRADGRVPGVLYGRGIDPISLSVDARALGHTLHTDAGANVLINLQIGGASHLTLARSVERDPIRGDVRHIDFLKIAADEPVKVDVPVHLDGEAKGVKEGGLIEHHLWQLHVECLPGNVPDRINVDVTAMEIGSVVHVSELAVPTGVTVLTPGDEIVVTCVVPQKPEEEAPAEEGLLEGEAPEGAEAEGEAGVAAEASESEGE